MKVRSPCIHCTLEIEIMEESLFFFYLRNLLTEKVNLSLYI